MTEGRQEVRSAGSEFVSGICEARVSRGGGNRPAVSEDSGVGAVDRSRVVIKQTEREKGVGLVGQEALLRKSLDAVVGRVALGSYTLGY